MSVYPVSDEPLTPAPPLSADSSSHSPHTRNPWQLASPANKAEVSGRGGKNVLVTVSAEHDGVFKPGRSVGKGWTVAINATRQLCYPESVQPGGGRGDRGTVCPPSRALQYPRPTPDENRLLAMKKPAGSKVQVGASNHPLEKQRLGKTALPRKQGRKKPIPHAHFKPKNNKNRDEEIR